MKKILLLALSAVCLPAFALPTYEPFTEYAANIATNTAGAQTNSIDLCTAGLIAPGGEPWVCQFFSGTDTNSTTHIAGLDIQVTNNPASAFTAATLANLLPATFPGFPAPGGAITVTVVNPAQPGNTNGMVGNSAALQFAQDFTRPSAGVKTLFVSYLFNDCQVGQTGSGNIGRYLNFVAASNVVAGAGTSSYANGWQAMNNTFSANTGPRYFGHGVFNPNPFTIVPQDSAAGKSALTNFTTFAYAPSLTSAAFVVGEFVFVSTNASKSGVKDTNILWVNPSIGGFGGATPQGSPILTYSMVITMNDVGGMVLLDRPGSGQAGGVGTNFLANLLLGSTWSYVTGGPEFTNQPAGALGSVGSTVSMTGAAAAANQSVTYQWQHVFDGTTNNLANGVANPGGSAIVSGATSGTLTLTGIGNGDTNGFYQLNATSSATGYSLASAGAVVAYDPLITGQPQEQFTTPGGTAVFNITAATQFPPLAYLWQLNGANLSDGTLADGSVISGSTTASLTIANAQKDENNDIITCGVTNGLGQGEISAAATLITTDPAITAQPQPVQLTANFGSQAVFAAAALTAPANQPLSYAWFHGAAQLADGTQPDGSAASGAAGVTSGNTLAAALTLSGVSYLDNGSYSLVVTNSLGLSATSAVATLFVNDPVINAEPPATVEVAQGANANIAVGAGGTSITYQWFNANGPLGADFSGANTATLTVTDAQTNDDGTYSVTIIGPTNSLTSANVNLIVDTPITGLTVSPGELVQQAGTHFALAGTVTGGTSGVLKILWQFNGVTVTNGTQADGTTVSGATSATLALANVHTADSGVYTLTASNAAGFLSASVIATVSANLLPLSPANLEVTRVGEGSQTLSGATGNTLYLDQFTTNGAYVSTFMVPDSGTSELIVPGAGSDALNESYLTLSSNKAYLNFTGYFEKYPFTGGSDVTVGGTAFVRGIGAVDAAGFYTLAYTNEGLYSGGEHFIRSAYSTDGLINFWTTGAAGSAAVKYVNAGPAGASYATGSGIPALSTAVTGPIVLGQVGPNLVFSDNSDSSLLGLQEFNGGSAPQANIATSLLLSAGNLADFAFSPDSNTVYVADSSPAINGGLGFGGGIQRWDLIAGVYTYEYNLEDTTGSGTNGARGMAVVYPSNIANWGQGVSGAVIYATTSEAAGNRLIQFTDTNVLSGGALAQVAVPTVLASAGPNQFLQGVRFGPVALPAEIVAGVQATNIFTGLSDTLTVTVSGDAPFSYQWQFDGANIAGATTSSLALTNLQATNSGTYSVTVSNPFATNTSSAVITVTNASPILVLGPQSRIETAGDHLAFTVAATGTLPIKYQWQFDGSNIAGATATAIQLTNISPAGSGTYSVIYSNQFGASTNSATLLVTGSLQPLSSNNLVVARVGDGAQALSAATGNTVYLDQYTPAGVYSNTIMAPDNAAAGSFIVSGGAAELPQGTVLSLSGNSNFLNFPGFASTYPATNALAGELVPRAVGAVNAFGYYSEPMTPITLYDGGGDDFFDSTVSSDGVGEFWTTGTAGSPPSVKYVVPATAGTAGGIGALAGSANGTRAAQIIAGNLVYSDIFSSPPGIWAFSGEPINTATSINVVDDAAGNPADFAASPDTVSFPPSSSTVYVCDSSSIANGGGIQRYDWNGSAYALSYTLGTGAGSAAGASCLAVDFSANATWGPNVTGAKIYATTTGNPGNSLIEIIDNGSNSTATVLATANPNQVLRGVRFGPVAGPAIIASNPQSANAIVGGTATFTVSAQNGPLTYQWQLNGANLANGPSPSGSGAVISGAQGPVLTISNVGPADDQGSFTVVISNPYPNGAAASAPAVLSVPVNITEFPVAFENVTNGGTAVFTVIATGGAPITYQWIGPCGFLADGLGGDPCDATATVSGSSTGTLMISNASPSDSGQYYVSVSNPDPSSTNTSLIPSVLDVYSGPPAIVSDIQPASLVLPVGNSVTFSVTVAGTPPLIYQWKQNGTNLSDNGRVSGSQTSVLTIANTQLSDSGNYQLFITNSAGVNSSSPAPLTVTLIGFNEGGGWTSKGNAIFISSSVDLTEGGANETSSVFLNQKLDVAAFLATWTYQESPGAGAADGTAFVLQNSPAGAAALGGGGGELGYVGITGGSIAFEFNIYNPNVIGIAIGTNGLGKGGTAATAGGPYAGTGAVNIASGDPIGVMLEYINGIASLTLTDSNTLAAYTTNYSVNVTNFVGGSSAYVGFTGAAGAVSSSQTVSDFFFTSLPVVAAAKAAGQTLVLTWPASAPGLVLQQTDSLSNPNWVNVTAVPALVNGQNQVTVAPTGSAVFYRLAIQ
ncbi:MAG TPA: immunoglobulin domain-containing protein [Verrucomicrobiae bacterium]|jgi:hypothetical protein